jgi:hypothetical protein
MFLQELRNRNRLQELVRCNRNLEQQQNKEEYKRLKQQQQKTSTLKNLKSMTVTKALGDRATFMWKATFAGSLPRVHNLIGGTSENIECTSNVQDVTKATAT